MVMQDDENTVVLHLELTGCMIHFKHRLPTLEKVESLNQYCLAIGEGILQTGELNVMKFKEAIAIADQDKCKLSIKKEHERMVRNNVWASVKLTNLPFDSKLLSSTWVTKTKENGKL